MSKPYRLTIYEERLIDRMLPFEARSADEAVAFAERQRFGSHAELWDSQGLIRSFPADAWHAAAGRLRRRAG